jgi:hypothetical protein
MPSSTPPARLFALLCVAGLAVAAPCTARHGAAPQEKPFEQSLVPGAASRFRIQLTLHTEVRGQATDQIGAKTYVKPFVRSAEAGLRWTATRRVVSLDGAGLAEIEETLDGFEESGAHTFVADLDSAKLLTALREALASWKKDRVLRYRETREGQLSSLQADGVPTLGEEKPIVLTLWLLRALRPAAALPGKAVRIGDRWEEPRSANLPPWQGIKGSEFGEWLESGAGGQLAATIHVVQQIRATAPRPAAAGSSAEGQGEAFFFAESLSNVSLLDGNLISATRSASREILWTLASVEGLPEPPQFRIKLSATVTIERSP